MSWDKTSHRKHCFLDWIILFPWLFLSINLSQILIAEAKHRHWSLANVFNCFCRQYRMTAGHWIMFSGLRSFFLCLYLLRWSLNLCFLCSLGNHRKLPQNIYWALCLKWAWNPAQLCIYGNSKSNFNRYYMTKKIISLRLAWSRRIYCLHCFPLHCTAN